MTISVTNGADDRRITGRRGTYVLVSISETAYEVLLKIGAGRVRTVGHAGSEAEAEEVIKAYDRR